MTLQDLRQRIVQQIGAGALVLDDTLLGTGQATALLLQDALGVPSLRVSAPALQASTDPILVSGTAALVGLAAVPVLLSLTLAADGTPELTLTATPAAGWTFSQSFPDLAGSWFDTLPLAGPRFILTSYAHPGDPGVALARGLNVEAQLGLQAALPILGAFGVALPTVTFSGTVTEAALGPVVSLATPLPVSLSLGPVRLASVTLGLSADFGPPPFDLGDDAGPSDGAEVDLVRTIALTLAGTVTVGDLAVRVSADIPTTGTLLTFEAALAGAPLLSLDHLFDLVGGGDFVAAIPAPLSGLGSFSLDLLRIGFDTGAKSVVFISFQIGTASWQVVPDHLTIASLSLGWIIAAPFDAANRSVATDVTGTLSLGSLTAQVGISTPDLTVTGYLPGAVALRFADLAGVVGASLPVPADFADFVFDDLSFTLDTGARSLALGFDTSITLDLFGDGKLGLTGTHVDVAALFAGGTPQVSADLTGTLTLGSVGFAVTAHVGQTMSFTGTELPGTSFSLKDIAAMPLLGDTPIATLFPDVALGGLAFAFDTGKGTFSISAQTAQPFSFSVGAATVAVAGAVTIAREPPANGQAPRYTGTLSGVWAVGSATFDLAYQLGERVLTGAWAAGSAGELAYPSLAGALGIPSAIDLPWALPDLGLTAASFTLDLDAHTFTLVGDSSKFGSAFFYADRGAAGWGFTFGVSLPAGSRFSSLPDPIGGALAPLDFVSFASALMIVSTVDRAGFTVPASPAVAGGVDLVHGFTAAARVDFSADGDLAEVGRALSRLSGADGLALSAKIGTGQGAKVSASLSRDFTLDGQPVTALAEIRPDGKIVVGVGFKSLAVGDGLRRLVHLVDPAFSLDDSPPWDAIFGLSIDNVSFDFSVTDRRVGFVADPALHVLGTWTVDHLEAWYARGKSVSVTISGSGPGLDAPLTWEPLNRASPALPAPPAPALDLRYLGVGQHVSLVSSTPLDTVEEVMNALENEVPAQTDPAHALVGLKFDAASGWLIGLDLTVLDAVTLSVVFNDPALYGLLVSLQGARVGALAGLRFEILYRKIADNLGVYHIDLALPEAMRHLEFGEVSVTLPVFTLDVYTNGSFLADLGFPHNFDFSRSAVVEMFPFVGAGGLYLGVLDGQAGAGLVPSTDAGVFKPIIAFGFGLQVGLGKTFEEGPLSAGVTVVVEGLLEGVLAFFHATAPGRSDATYFSITGAVGIVAHVFGSIDFVIVSARLDITVSASAHLAYQSHRALQLGISASVSVSLSVTICCFITIDLDFSATVTEQFTIDSDSSAPWDRLAA